MPRNVEFVSKHPDIEKALKGGKFTLYQSDAKPFYRYPTPYFFRRYYVAPNAAIKDPEKLNNLVKGSFESIGIDDYEPSVIKDFLLDDKSIRRHFYFAIARFFDYPAALIMDNCEEIYVKHEILNELNGNPDFPTTYAGFAKHGDIHVGLLSRDPSTRLVRREISLIFYPNCTLAKMAYEKKLYPNSFVRMEEIEKFI